MNLRYICSLIFSENFNQQIFVSTVNQMNIKIGSTPTKVHIKQKLKSVEILIQIAKKYRNQQKIHEILNGQICRKTKTSGNQIPLILLQPSSKPSLLSTTEFHVGFCVKMYVMSFKIYCLYMDPVTLIHCNKQLKTLSNVQLLYIHKHSHHALLP